MDSKYKEKLRGLQVGAMGGEEAYQEMLRKKGLAPEPIDSSVDEATSQRFRDVQQKMIEQERMKPRFDERPERIQMLPPGMTEQEANAMTDEFMDDEIQPPVPSRFNKLKSKFQK